MIKELLVSFLACLCVGAIINGMPPAPVTATQPAVSGGAELTTTQPAATGEAETSTTLGQAQETSEATFDQDVLQANVPVLVDFSATWCEPCKMMAPVIDKLAKDYDGKIKVFKVDVDKSPGLKDKYQVSAFPTFMMFRGGRSVSQHSGAMPQEMLAGVIDRQLGTQ